MSTPMLASLAQVKAHLKIDTDDADADLTLKLRAASKTIIDYIRNGADDFTDSAGDVYLDTSGDPIGVPEDVQIATLFLVGVLDRNRNGDEPGIFVDGYLPPACTCLLAHYRDPPLA